MIAQFAGPHAFLSNFHPSPLTLDGITYPTVEHAFQAHKTDDRATRLAIAAKPKPGQAKYAGKRVALRHNWEEVKEDVMYILLALKFAPGSDLARQLLATGDAPLVEGNVWGDRYWGVCKGTGRNRLGELLMEVRAGLRA